MRSHKTTVALFLASLRYISFQSCFLCVLGALLPACVHKSNEHQVSQEEASIFKTPSITELRSGPFEEAAAEKDLRSDSQKDESAVDLWQQGIKGIDLPSPLQAEPFVVSLAKSSKQMTAVGYRSALEYDVLLSMCKQDMNMLGWQEAVSFSGAAESVLVFDKPDKMCVAVIRSSKKRGYREIVYYMKRGSKLHIV